MNNNLEISDAYWLSPSHEIHPVKRTHIAFISENPEKFGITKPEYYAYFDKYHEPYGFEGKARKEIMQLAMKNGWIRIRNNINKGWVCEVWKIDGNSTSNVLNWMKNCFQFDNEPYESCPAGIELHDVSKSIEGRPESEWKLLI